MEMKEVYKNDLYKILSVSLNVSEAMPLHYATSDAFIIVKKGKGRISFADRQVTLMQGESLLIKANETHKMEILEDFSANVILNAEARINFNDVKTL
ncbi:cupin domain-containing protein [Segetibacter koreensis]|uniref:cupin domain-containing protein n=1 Tax=Segetibacter koreensis TaxID=398037 RepID=UPI000372F351|nr:cupin domain-containing protein [Segetibacter koreensis]